MEVTQIAEIVNEANKEAVGEAAVSSVDLNDIVSTGAEILDTSKVDHYVRSLIDHIGRVVFVNRPYTGTAPSIMMDSWEFGAIKEKITYEGVPEAEENESWELVDRKSYDPNIFYKPEVSAKFFTDIRTFEVPMSFAQKQVKSAFSNAGQLQSFFSMIETAISNGMTVKMDQLVLYTLANTITTLYSNYATRPGQVYKLLTMYAAATGQTAPTAAVALTNDDFIKFCAYTMKRVASRMANLSTVFNMGEKHRHTPKDRMKIILHSDFTAAADAYLQSDTFHNEFVRLPESDTISYWQGSGTSYAWADTSKVIAIPSGGNSAVTVSNIVGLIFDREALGVSNLDRRVTTNWNPKGEFTNNWYKFDAGYFNDFNENSALFVLE